MARQFEMTQNAILTLHTAGKTCTEDIKVNVAVPGEDVAAETEAYTEKLLVLETAITELENELDGKINGENVSDETEIYTDKIATLEIAITALETELQGKASCRSVETCTLTIRSEGPPDSGSVLWYTDGASSVRSIALPNHNETISIIVLKNSIVVSTCGGQGDVNTTNLTIGNIAAFFISDDSSIIIA